MNEFIEKNRALLHSYYIGARIIGWSLVIMAIVVAVEKSFSGFSNVDERLRFYMICRVCEQLVLGFALLGLVLLGLAQFVRYLYEVDYQPGWILRHGDKILYLYAVSMMVSPTLQYILQMKLLGYRGAVHVLMFLLSAIVPAIARALIFVGMAKILKRIVPVIEESKTLV
jgi:hypothetical protein